MRHVACDICGLDDAKLFAARTPALSALHARFVRCKGCGFVYADPRAEAEDARAFYSAVEARGSSAAGEPTASEAWRRAVSGRRAHLLWAARELGNPARATFLEIGFGDGSALAAARALGWDAHGIEYGNWLVDAARRRLGFDTVYDLDLAEVPLPRGSVDVVYSWHVIEHVLDVRAWLREISALLRPGGVVILGTESADSLAGRLQVAGFRLLRRVPWPPTSTDHTYWFSADTLGRLLRESGLEPSRIDTYENGPVEILRSETVARLRNPRWLAQLSLYLLGSLAAQVKPSVGGKLVAVAVKT